MINLYKDWEKRFFVAFEKSQPNNGHSADLQDIDGEYFERRELMRFNKKRYTDDERRFCQNRYIDP